MSLRILVEFSLLFESSCSPPENDNMNPSSAFKDRPLRAWSKYDIVILTGMLACFSLPPTLFVPVLNSLEYSWKPALNEAVVHHLVLGRDFMFTYGPLGFLSTRNAHPDMPVTMEYKILEPEVEHPVLINKLIGDNPELKNFMTGDIKSNHNVRQFMLPTDDAAMRHGMKVTFWRFVNY